LLFLVIHVDRAKVSIYIEKKRSGVYRNILLLPYGRLEIEFDPAPKQMVSDLKSKTGSANAAKKIYDIHRVAFENFEALLLSKANLKYVYPMKFISESEFFSEDGIHGESVEWSIDSSDFVAFKPKLPSSRKINPMYKSDQLISVSKWKKLQEAADNFEFLEDELLELYRIRNKAYMEQRKTAAIETSIISETLLREYGLKVLRVQGFSNNKINKIKDELTFNNLLNIVLPLSLTKSKFSKISQAVTKVDSLRKIRNDLVHGNKMDTEVEVSDVIERTEGAIKLVNFLKKKIKERSRISPLDTIQM
jgi:hypothetical protein